MLAFFLFPIKARSFILILAAVEAFLMVAHPQSNISHVGHLGGALIGYLYLKKLWHVRRFTERIRWKFKKIKFKFEDSDDDQNQSMYH